MKEIDLGHKFELQSIDGNIPVILTFVKREGQKFPGNIGTYPGTNMQEVLRAVLARLAYLDGQERDDRNSIAAGHIGRAIFLLEQRAAERHGRTPPGPIQSIWGEVCRFCGHVGCEETCEKKK